MDIIDNRRFDEERALYASRDIAVRNCTFDGPADGESALKESSDVRVDNCFFNLRYPFWHDRKLEISGCELTPLCRAALWYSTDVSITGTKLHGIKALRECSRVSLEGCDIISPEFGWSVNELSMTDCTIESEYFLMRSRDIKLDGVRMKGKYSFQYVEDGTLEHCEFDTKDAFWHAKGVTVRDSVIKGEYLGWYSDGLTLINCRIIGTQPLCYCKNLTLKNCTMEQADLAFEYSEVNAELRGEVLSVKNPRSGSITADGFGEVILSGSVVPLECAITSRSQEKSDES